MPEPMDLIAKTVVLNDEPIKTGAAIAFINIERFTQGRKIEIEKLAHQNGVATAQQPSLPIKPLEDAVSEIRTNQTKLAGYLSAMFDIDKVVYCRYGRDYIPAIAKQA